MEERCKDKNCQSSKTLEQAKIGVCYTGLDRHWDACIGLDMHKARRAYIARHA